MFNTNCYYLTLAPNNYELTSNRTVTIINKWLEIEKGKGGRYTPPYFISLPQFLSAIATGVPFKPYLYPTKFKPLVIIP